MYFLVTFSTVLTLSALCSVETALAQTTDDTTSYIESSDSSLTHSRAVSDWTEDTLRVHKGQSPTLALFKSLLVPGLGQLGNRQYIKAGLVVAIEGYLISRWADFRKQTVDARSAIESEPIGSIQRQLLFEDFSAVRNRRNLHAWLAGTAIFISMFDALVDAHLRNFPAKNSEISLGTIRRNFVAGSPELTVGAKLTYRF